ncbi:MAG: GFA family protein [Hyphomonas sp.]|nr:GFA family protein [Hyphomonas sp.]MCA8905414.1 GFA family protein [Hyphomonas sp.]MCB9960555.1 GFA family protein [Hyphomonas sp.]MCB9972772.1 GFA family protein [Hyphomonas sp.]HPE49559.1 GFA family protein [Hyphomonas sp.]
MIEGTCHCGKVHWTFEGDPGGATACNCTLCRRYGALWIYDYENECIHLTGPVASYTRAGKEDPALEILFCPACGGVAAWRGLRPDENGRIRMAVNVRLAEPDTVADLPIDHFDGYDTFDDLGRDGRCVRDMWF